jgi:hypothetical protein
MSTDRLNEKLAAQETQLDPEQSPDSPRRLPDMASMVYKKADAARLRRFLVLGSATAALIMATLDLDPKVGRRFAVSPVPATRC